MLLKIDENEVATLVQELVRIPTTNPPGLEKGCAEFVLQKLIQWNISAELLLEPYETRPQVWGQVLGLDGGPTLVLNGHLDVVPEGDATRWDYPPFEGKIVNGRVYGRGTSDMKGGLAAMMITAKILSQMKDQFWGKLLLQFAMGEETGEPGTKYMLLNKGLLGEYGIVLEPTGLKVATAGKGVAWFQVTFWGRPVHGSVAEQGVNAIEKAMKFIQEIKNYDGQISYRIHPLLGNSRCSVTMISGGTKENVIPESCIVILDRRFLPEESVDNIEREIQSILNGLASRDSDFKYAMKRRTVYEAAEMPQDCLLARVVRNHSARVTGISKEPYGTLFSTDARNLINDAKIEAIAFGPGEPDQPHTFNESIKIDEVVKCIQILLLTVKELLVPIR